MGAPEPKPRHACSFYRIVNMLDTVHVPVNDTEYLLDSGLGNCTVSQPTALIGNSQLVGCV